MIETNLLAQFVAFAKAGTLTRAAQDLHTSQPALTRSMKKLEEELEVPLFVRHKNHLELTQTGRYAVYYAQRVLQENQDFCDRIRSYDRSLHTLSIGYCAPVPQMVLTPLLNGIFQGMTLSADMKDDVSFPEGLRRQTYQLAVMHARPDGDEFFVKKCGSEKLYISVRASDPLAFYPEVRLQDLDGRAILLFSHIGFWMKMTREKTPHARYLLQIQRDTFWELSEHSDYPYFSSSYFLKQGQKIPGRINIALADPECQTDYYLVCLKSEQKRYEKLFQQLNDRTISL